MTSYLRNDDGSLSEIVGEHSIHVHPSQAGPDPERDDPERLADFFSDTLRSHIKEKHPS